MTRGRRKRSGCDSEPRQIDSDVHHDSGLDIVAAGSVPLQHDHVPCILCRDAIDSGRHVGQTRTSFAVPGEEQPPGTRLSLTVGRPELDIFIAIYLSILSVASRPWRRDPPDPVAGGRPHRRITMMALKQSQLPRTRVPSQNLGTAAKSSPTQCDATTLMT